ncbi:MAG: hypothetical protein HY040_07610 [Planctomycetes bacterium]|nr:hypothetical protein [Planctomycetota bacterium]
MWNEQKRKRFQQLRERESELTDVERAELAILVHELDTAELTYLSGATERLRHQRLNTEAQLLSLEALARRRQALVQRLDNVLSEARAERHAIESELASVLADTRNSNTQE